MQKERISTMTPSSFLGHCNQTTAIGRMRLTPLKRAFDKDYDAHKIFKDAWKNV